jgi:hypothetical protein
VNGKADVTVGGMRFTVYVRARGVTILDDRGTMGKGGGNGSISRGGTTVAYKVVGHDRTTAVVNFSTS